jgi:hypothetical protein
MKRIEELKKAARRGDWDFVDRRIAEIVDEPIYYKWAFLAGTGDLDGNVRDLAVSIIERSNIPEKEFAVMRMPLYQLMLEDDNIYVGFRAAFALANHGPGAYKESVIEKLGEARRDKDVESIARGYLNKLKTKLKG